MIFGNIGTNLISYSYKPFGESSSTHAMISDGLLTWAASINTGLVNGGSRLVFGKLADRFSFRSIMLVIMTLDLINCIGFYWAANIPAIYFICIMINYLIIAGFYTTFPVSVTKVFGLKRGPQVFV